MAQSEPSDPLQTHAEKDQKLLAGLMRVFQMTLFKLLGWNKSVSVVSTDELAKARDPRHTGLKQIGRDSVKMQLIIEAAIQV